MRASARMSEVELASFMQQRTRNSTNSESSRSPKRETDSLESLVTGALIEVTRPYRISKLKQDYKAVLVQELAARDIQVEPEFKIFESRKFRADWWVVGTKILIEYEGGIFHKGKQGHDSVKGLLRDIEKGNLCAIGGWTVIRVAPNHVTSGEALKWIEIAIEAEGAKPQTTEN